MKKVLLLYSEQFRNLDLSVIADLLRNVLNEKSIECEIKVCNHLIADEAKFEEYDIIAGYHLDVYQELLLSEKFVGRYLHFFDSYCEFKFSEITKREEMGGYSTYRISQVPS